MKTVFTNQEVFHIFASGTQSQGRSHNGNVYFEGHTLYSYGSHFPLAIKYNGSFLLNGESYSITTSKHQSQARQALRHLDCITLPALRVVQDLLAMKARSEREGATGYEAQRLPIECAAYVKGMSREIKNAQEKQKRARSEWRKREWARVVDYHEKAALFVWQEIAGKKGNPIESAQAELTKEEKRRVKENIARDLAAFTWENKAAIARKRFAEMAAMRKRLNAEGDLEYTAIRLRTALESVQSELNRKALAVNVATRDHITKADQARLEAAYAIAGRVWQKYFARHYKAACREIQRFHDMAYSDRVARFHARELHRLSGDVVCRLHEGQIETSQGARVPLGDAIKLFNAARVARKAGKQFTATQARGNEIGRYMLNHISAQGDARVGCHLLKWDAMVDCARRYVPELLADMVQA